MIKISQKKFTINDGYEIIDSQDFKEIENIPSGILKNPIIKEKITATTNLKSIKDLEKEEKEEKKRTLEQENKKHIKDIKRLKEKNTKLKEENKKLNQENKKLNKIKNTINATNEKINQYEKENKKLNQENTKLKDQIRIFSINTLTIKNPTNEEIKQLIEQFQEKLNLKHFNENQNIKIELNSAQNKNKTQEKEIERLKNDKNDLQKQLNDKKTELRNVKNKINTTNQEIFENNNLTENINKIIQNLYDINSKFQQTTKLNNNILEKMNEIKDFDNKINSAQDIYCKKCGKDKINKYDDHNAGRTVVIRYSCNNCNCKWSKITDKPIDNITEEEIKEIDLYKDKTFDNFLKGNENIKTIRSPHFNEELDENGIKFEYIQSKIEKDEILTSDYLDKNRYALYLKAPIGKYYDEIKIVLACYNNIVIFITVNPCLNDGKKRKEYYGENEHEKTNKLRRKAVEKRKR